MTDRAQELRDLTARFIDAFNRQNLDDVADFFAKDAVYEDSRGETHVGPAAIRQAFEPLVTGARGKIKFFDEDYFSEPASNKVMASWTLQMEVEGKPVKMRGMDILEFEGEKLTKKLAYCKSAAPRLDDA